MMTEPECLVLIPVYNDWEAVCLLLPQLDRALMTAGFSARVLLVDDGSTDATPGRLTLHPYRALGFPEVLSLRRNMGHQRAIAIALAYVEDCIRPKAVVVMDGDGEDSPDDVPRLLDRLRESGGGSVVFAERRRRSESLTFRVCYATFRLLHRVLTGIPVRVGNFSVVPAPQLRRIVVVSELWNHYAAAVFKARVPRTTIPTERRKRLCGQPRMNFVGLVAHGLSALSVHAEAIGVRLLLLAGCGVGLLVAALGAVLMVRLFTPFAIPGWATSTAGLLLVVLLQAFAFVLVFVFLVLHARSQPVFIPLRDYRHFIHTDEGAAVPRLARAAFPSDRVLNTGGDAEISG